MDARGKIQCRICGESANAEPRHAALCPTCEYKRQAYVTSIISSGECGGINKEALVGIFVIAERAVRIDRAMPIWRDDEPARKTEKAEKTDGEEG